jgi:hypothetical protein
MSAANILSIDAGIFGGGSVSINDLLEIDIFVSK